MYAKRMAYVVFFRGKHVIKRIKSLPVDVQYVSKKQNYAILYGDADQEQALKKQLKNTKGFKYIGPSRLYDENLNF
ncbi:MAG: DUF2129 domain-containing protein [Acholeplasmataceae bacterium]